MTPSQKQYGSLLVVDDHNMIVNGIRLLIGDQFQDIWQANTIAAGLALATATRILAYSFNGYSAAVLKMFGAGVHGYVIKSEDDEEFVRAVGTLLEGKEYFCREARNHIIHRVFPEEEHPRLIVANTGFSAKEIEIIRLICQQKTAREISSQVYLSERTVEQYRSNISKRIGARNIAGIIRFALQNHIIDLADL